MHPLYAVACEIFFCKLKANHHSNTTLLNNSNILNQPDKCWLLTQTVLKSKEHLHYRNII